MAKVLAPEERHPTRYWQLLADGRVECTLCPRRCQLRDGHRGVCFVRMADAGQIWLTSYGRSSGFCIDPIEKKPLNHFLPGTPVLSFGTAGCNLTCKFCQNADISKSRDLDTLCASATPQQLVDAAELHGCRSIAFTYNDPTVFMEYALDVAQLARQRGIAAVAVSAGYIEAEPRRELYAAMDAANIDLKGFSEQFYHRICGGHLAPVLDTLLYLRHETWMWLEITTLLIPGLNDSDSEIAALARWLHDGLGADVPLHFTAFHPDFHLLDVPPTPSATLTRARHIAQQQGLHYVYTGNVHDVAGGSTHCPACGALLIERDWYQLGRWGLDDHGCCRQCGYQLPGRFEAEPGHWGPRRQPLVIG